MLSKVTLACTALLLHRLFRSVHSLWQSTSLHNSATAEAHKKWLSEQKQQQQQQDCRCHQSKGLRGEWRGGAAGGTGGYITSCASIADF